MMNKILILGCSLLVLSSVALADDTTTCANGAGIVVIGAVTGHKYCMSKKQMNWWNALSWCDGQDRRQFDRSDCACSDVVSNCYGSKCPELNGITANAGYGWAWASLSSNFGVYWGSGSGFGPSLGRNDTGGIALCY